MPDPAGQLARLSTSKSRLLGIFTYCLCNHAVALPHSTSTTLFGSRKGHSSLQLDASFSFTEHHCLPSTEVGNLQKLSSNMLRGITDPFVITTLRWCSNACCGVGCCCNLIGCKIKCTILPTDKVELVKEIIVNLFRALSGARSKGSFEWQPLQVETFLRSATKTTYVRVCVQANLL